MDERLRILILDDKKVGTWDDVLAKLGFASYLDVQMCTHLEKALQFLQEHYKELHIVLSDFFIEEGDNVVQYLGSDTFEVYRTAAMGANVTLLSEGLRRSEDCKILINRLYTTEDANLRTYSVESNLLFTYYKLDDPKILRPLMKTQLFQGLTRLLKEALEEVQQLFFSRSKSISEVQRRLHAVLSSDLAIDLIRADIKSTKAVSKLVRDLSKPRSSKSLSAFKELVFLLLSEYMEVELTETNTNIRLPLYAFFPDLYSRYHRYSKYSTCDFTPLTLKEFVGFIEALDGIQQLHRDNTQMFGMWLRNSGITRFFHTWEPIPGTKEGRLDSKIISAVNEKPLNEVFGLKEFVHYLDGHGGPSSSKEKKSLADYFKYGDNQNKQISTVLKLDGAFLGFRLDGKIVNQIIDNLRQLFGQLTLNNAGAELVVKPSKGEPIFTDRIFTDKKRILTSVKYFLDEAEGHLNDNKRIDISFSYYEKLHCAQLAIEDHGNGVVKKTFDEIGKGTPTDGGWAGIKEQLKGWVEDIWVVTKAADGDHAKSLITHREVESGHKTTSGTMLIVLFNFIADPT